MSTLVDALVDADPQPAVPNIVDEGYKLLGAAVRMKTQHAWCDACSLVTPDLTYVAGMGHFCLACEEELSGPPPAKRASAARKRLSRLGQLLKGIFKSG